MKKLCWRSCQGCVLFVCLVVVFIRLSLPAAGMVVRAIEASGGGSIMPLSEWAYTRMHIIHVRDEVEKGEK